MPSIKLGRGRALLSALLLWFLFLALLIAGVTFIAPGGARDRYVYGCIGTIAALLATVFVLRMNRSAWVDAGLKWDRFTGIRFLLGVAAGFALMGVLLVLIFVSTGIRPVLSHGFCATTLLPLGALLPLALMEEIAFRGYAFSHLQRQYGVWLAQVTTAVAFAIYHILNGWPLVMSLLGPGTWAFVFGIAAARTGGIALPTGIHLGLNAAQALVGLGIATTSMSAFQLTNAEGVTGVTLTERMATAGLVAQALFLSIALLLTYRLAKRTAKVRKEPLGARNQDGPSV